MSLTILGEPSPYNQYCDGQDVSLSSKQAQHLDTLLMPSSHNQLVKPLYFHFPPKAFSSFFVILPLVLIFIFYQTWNRFVKNLDDWIRTNDSHSQSDVIPSDIPKVGTRIEEIILKRFTTKLRRECGRRASNSQPSVWKTGALPIELHPHNMSLLILLRLHNDVP